MPLKRRLLLSGVIAMCSVLILASVSLFSLWQSELNLERQINVTQAVRHELTADIAHSHVAAAVVSAVLLGQDGAEDRKAELQAAIEAEAQNFRAEMDALQALELPEHIRSMVASLLPLVDGFNSTGAEVAALAFTNTQDGADALPAFQSYSANISEKLSKLGKAIKASAAETAAEARQYNQNLLYLVLGISAVATLIMLHNSRKVTLSIIRPIERMRAALREVAQGDFSLKVADRMRADDFGDIAHDIDAVSGRVVKALEEQNKLRQQGEAVIERLRQALQHLSAGDFSDRISEKFGAEYEALRANYNETVDKLNELLSQVVQAGGRLNRQADGIRTGAEDLSARTESQAATLEQTAAALEQMTASVNSSAQNAQEVQGAVEAARADVERSGEVVEGAIAAMNEIENSSNQIGQIIGVIDDIAFQTNLLALNAGVEAARAGEVGRGFAVVASEVRALAQRSSDAAMEIKGLISASSAHVQDGVHKVDGAGKALETVVTQVSRITELVAGISRESAEQAQGLNEINIGVAQLDSVTQKNASMVEETGSAIRAMSSETVELNRMVGQFVLLDSAPSAAARLPAAPAVMAPSAPPENAPASHQAVQPKPAPEPAQEPEAELDADYAEAMAGALEEDRWVDFNGEDEVFPDGESAGPAARSA
ncbi:methyl-accepting chemotaxis protein [Leisingera sp. S132]|uniref:methyl-accepting chemotaxis protein n=1 Tax=Leisingera sp. S132 TaxID=2867016 RepID=UPI0021A80711|nr:HAMP domain-containing methyl-accepting chemotaxis protein [Leisingera sp. S132]UWQ78151.1 methyl-accepting chemotaxis protein [Leisingera sp. S132]